MLNFFCMSFYVTRVPLGGTHFDLRFHKIQAGRNVKYFILAIDTKGTEYPFCMEEKNGEWRLIHAPKPIDDVIKNEQTLSRIIKLHLAR